MPPYPLCILKKSFTFFYSAKVVEVFLSVGKNCVHMGLMFDGKFQSSVSQSCGKKCVSSQVTKQYYLIFLIYLSQLKRSMFICIAR